MKFLAAVLACAAAPLISGCPTTHSRPLPQPRSATLTGAYVHSGSGITLPEWIGEFQRDAVTRYDVEGSNIGVAYNCLNVLHPVAATVYVYPSPSLVSIGSPQRVIDDTRALLTEGEFERVVNEILHAHPGANLIERRNSSRTENAKTFPGKVAIFEYDGPFAGRTIAVRSHMYLFCYVQGKWTVKYRFTRPKVDDSDKDVQEFIDRLSWGGK